MANSLVLFALFAVAHSAEIGCATGSKLCKDAHLIGCEPSSGGGSCTTADKCEASKENVECGTISSANDATYKGKCLADKTCLSIDPAKSVHVDYSVVVPQTARQGAVSKLGSPTFLSGFAKEANTAVLSNVPTCPVTLTSNVADKGMINKTDDSIVFDVSGGKLTCTGRHPSDNPTACTLVCPADTTVTVVSALKCSAASEWNGEKGECTPAAFGSVLVTAKDAADKTALLAGADTFKSKFRTFINSKVDEISAVGDVEIVGYKSVAGQVLQVQVNYFVKVSTQTKVSSAKPKLSQFDKIEFATGLGSRTVALVAGACPKYDAPVTSDGHLACSDFFVNSEPCTRSCKPGYGVKTTPTKKCTDGGAGNPGTWVDNASVTGVCAEECDTTGGVVDPINHGITFVEKEGESDKATLTCSDRFIGSNKPGTRCSLSCEPGFSHKGSDRYCGATEWDGSFGTCVAATNVGGSAKMVLQPSEHSSQAAIVAGTNVAFNDKFKAAVASQITGARPADVTIISIKGVAGRRLNERAVQVDYTVRVLNEGMRA